MVNEDQQENAERQQPEATWVPDTYVIIFFVVLLAAVATYFVPLGQFDTREVTYTDAGEEQTQTVLVPDSFSGNHWR